VPRGPSRPHPPMSVTKAAEIAHAIRDHNAGKPMNRILLAEALDDRSPSSSDFRDAITASGRYGFTKGSYAAEMIELTELGERLTKPRSQDEQLDALREALYRIPIFQQLLNHFANNKLPTAEFLKNTLERPPFNIQPEWSGEVAEVFAANGREVGFIRVVNGSPYVILEAGPPTEQGDEAASEHQVAEEQLTGFTDSPASGANGASIEPGNSVETPPPTIFIRSGPQHTNQFFIAHGWDKDALGQLQKILKGFDIPYVVAEEEANVGRPISEKVRDLLKSCSAGIFVFSADEEFQDGDGNIVWRPRENIIFELGAASLEYGRRIVIFKEKAVTFPSDFRDLGYIEFEKGNLEAKAMDLLKELIALKAVRITAGG